MGINYNGTNIEKIVYNGTELTKVIYNGVVVWEGIQPLVMDVTGIERAIRIVFTNPNNYEADVGIILDYDYSEEWNVKVPANGEKELVINDLTDGYYEVLVSYYINKKHFQVYAEVNVLPFQKVVTSVYTKPNTIGFVLNNKNSFEVSCVFIIDSSWEGSYFAEPGKRTTYDISIPGKAGKIVYYKVTYGDGSGITFNDQSTGSIYIKPDTVETTTTTYALSEPTSTEGNFKYYQGGNNK